MNKWSVVVDKYPTDSPIAGLPRYSVVDKLGNVIYITSIKELAEELCTAYNL